MVEPTDWLGSSRQSPKQPSGTNSKRSWTRRHKTGLGVVFAGVVAGGVLAGTLGASAATGAGPSGEGPAHRLPGMGEGLQAGPPAGRHGGHWRMHGDAKPLAAALTASLKAKALAAVPGGTVHRVGAGHGTAAYEAQVTKADGTRVRVTFDKNLTVLAVTAETGRGGPWRGGPMGRPGGGPGGEHPMGSPPE